MEKLKTDLKSMVKSLKVLEEKTKRMAKKVDKLEKAQAPKEPRGKPKAAKKAVAKKPAKLSANETVLAIIKRSRKAIDKAALIKKTGFEGKKIKNITYRLIKQGKIRKDQKGLYVKA